MDSQTARGLHQAGRRGEAETAYRAALLTSPNDHAALHGLGVLRHQAGDAEEACRLLRRAHEADPANAACAFDLGLAEFRAGRLAEAAAAFSLAGRLNPGWPLPHYEHGRALAALGEVDQAARAYRTALRLQPDFPPAEVNLANLLKAAGKTDQAIAAYRRVLRRHPDEPEVHHNLAVALQDTGDTRGAETGFRAALRLRPDFPAALEALATLLLKAERWADAVPVAQAACRAMPDRAGLAEMLGDACRGAGRAADAMAAYTRALALSPTRHSARFGMAEALRLQRDFAGAESVLRALAPDLPPGSEAAALLQHDLGNILRDLGRFEDAEAAYRASLAVTETRLALNHLAAVLRDLGRLEEAQAAAERGLAMPGSEKDTLSLRYNLAITHLTAGRLREGFALYEARFAKYKVARLPSREWTGHDLRGRRILVTAEQGLGDTLQFIRYLPALAQRGARITLLTPSSLTRLLHGFPGVDTIIPNTGVPNFGVDPAAIAAAHDFHVALMSLPYRLGLHDACPIPVPYLAADAAGTKAWRQRMLPLPGLRVGLAWAGNPGFQADHLRSIPPACLAPLAAARGVSFVSLQKGATALPPLPLADWTAELHDLAETASLIAALDLVVSVDTAVAHLAGALGKPVWLLNRFDTCWRWGAAAGDCLWYPSLRQFRQERPGDWAGPIARITTEIGHISPS